jgi:hypothetical protein
MAGLLLKKITQYWLKRPKRIIATYFVPALNYRESKVGNYPRKVSII